MTPSKLSGTDAPPTPLTVGLVVAGNRVPSWVEEAMDAIAAGGERVVTEVVEPGSGQGSRPGFIGRATLRGYGLVDGLVFGRDDDPSRLVKLRPGTVPSPGDSPDLVIRLDGVTGSVERWPTPRIGTWILEHGPDLPASLRGDGIGLLAGGAEMLLGRTFTITRLLAGSGPDGPVIGKVVSKVDRLSLRRGSRGHLGKMPGLLARGVAAARAGEGAPAAMRRAPDPDASGPELTTLRGRTWGSWSIVVGLARVVVGYVARLGRRKVAPDRWAVAVSRGPGPIGVAGRTFRFLEVPDDREWADPFPVRHDGRDLVFIEEFFPAESRGRLAVVELDDSPRGWRTIDTVLELPTHLSYPFVFEWSGSWYLLPEQMATGRLQLYVADRFPTTWRWHSTPLDLPAADATLARIDDRWWLFTTLATEGSLAADELHLFHAESPLGPWTAHPGNPVVSDIRTARPAGRVYQQDGTWYRIAQDGAAIYGHSIVILRVDRLDLDGYEQTVVEVIRPDWAPGLRATHTLNREADLVVVDGMRPRPRFHLPGRR